MIKRTDPWHTRSTLSKWAHVIERTGLALTGAACGLFVAAHVGRAGIDLIGSAAAVLAMMLYGAAGFLSRYRSASRSSGSSNALAAPAWPRFQLGCRGTNCSARPALFSPRWRRWCRSPALFWTRPHAQALLCSSASAGQPAPPCRLSPASLLECGQMLPARPRKDHHTVCP
jgi:hypothetical protein